MEFKSPVYNVIAVPISKIIPNTYNPNAVAPPELKLLYDSIKEDGYTMPVVCYYSKSRIYMLLLTVFIGIALCLSMRIYTDGKRDCCLFL